jgi:hypothetical protein
MHFKEGKRKREREGKREREEWERGMGVSVWEGGGKHGDGQRGGKIKEKGEKKREKISRTRFFGTEILR